MSKLGSHIPQKVATDAVIPLHFFDDTPLWRAFVLYTVSVIGDILDPEALRQRPRYTC